MFNFISEDNMNTIVDALFSISILIVISISARFFLISLGQTWIKTYAHTATLTILPIITFIITKVISGNIALSLGMVGALSIVRFRNPVKSPFELSVYFGSITMGIAASVSMPWLGIYVFSIGSALVVLAACNQIHKVLFKKAMFEVSFSEGNQLSTLEINSIEKIDYLMNSELLISHSKTDSEYCYVLASGSLTDLKKICTQASINKSIIRYQLSS